MTPPRARHSRLVPWRSRTAAYFPKPAFLRISQAQSSSDKISKNTQKSAPLQLQLKNGYDTIVRQDKKQIFFFKKRGETVDKFILHSEYKPTGDQPEAIEALTNGVKKGFKEQTLLGVTGSGKTFTMANIIANVNRPTLVLAHNKTLAAQLCSEFREFFPENAVEYFVS